MLSPAKTIILDSKVASGRPSKIVSRPSARSSRKLRQCIPAAAAVTDIVEDHSIAVTTMVPTVEEMAKAESRIFQSAVETRSTVANDKMAVMDTDTDPNHPLLRNSYE